MREIQDMEKNPIPALSDDEENDLTNDWLGFIRPPVCDLTADPECEACQ